MPPAPPAYLRIAHELRERIRDGTHPPGAKLPTIERLCARYRVSEIVIRHAFGVLRAEGLIDTRRGGGTVVRARPPVRRVAMDRYRVESAGTSFTRDQDISWSEYRLERAYSRADADPDLAARFDLDPGTPLLRRHFVFWARGEPQQISVNYLPWSLVEGTPVADPDWEPWPGGTLAQLAFLGHPVTRVEETVRARMPSAEEAGTLRMGSGVPVLAVGRRLLSGEQVLEVCRDIVIPADRTALDYSLDL